MTRMHDKIRQILESTPSLTQRGLAEKMGLNPAAVNRMLYGRRNIMAEEVPIIEQYLGQKLSGDHVAAQGLAEYKQGQRGAAPRGFSDIAQTSFSDAAAFVPVYAYESGVRSVVDWVQRHPAQAGISAAFAIYVSSDDMTPRYFRGELVYIHPGRPPAANGDCLIETVTGEWLVRRLSAHVPGGIHVQQFNPPREATLAQAAIKALYTIVGRA